MGQISFFRLQSVIALAFLAALLFQTKAFAASSYVCLRNTGDVPIEVAVLYKDDWGGWVAEGWWRIEPQGIMSSCAIAPEVATSSNFFRLAVRQKGSNDRWGSAAFDVEEYRFDQDGSDTVGATYKLVPRSTLESSQTTGFLGERDIAGVKLILCAPEGGTKTYGSLQDEMNCSGREIHTLFSTLIYTPTDGGMLQDNVYEVWFASSASASVFFPPFSDDAGVGVLEKRGNDSAKAEAPPVPGLRKSTKVDPPLPVGVPLSSEKVSGLYWGAIAGNCRFETSQSAVAPCALVRKILNSNEFEIVSCSYGPFNSDGTGFETYQFWKDRAPSNLEQFAVPGDVHPFSYLGSRALQKCPADTAQLQEILKEVTLAAP